MGYAFSVSWSVTRSRSLAGCPRAHWFNYYLDGEEEAGLGKLLKRLTTLEMLAGQVVDSQVNRALDCFRDRQQVPDDLVADGLRAFDRLLQVSRREVERMRESESLSWNSQPLLTDYYALAREPEREDRCRRRIERAIAGLLISGVFRNILRVKVDRWSPAKVDTDIKAVSWELGDITVWCALDLWLDFGSKGLVVIDWKSGSFSDDAESLQLATYSLWAQESKGLERDRVLVQAVHLPEAPSWDAKPVSDLEYESARGLIEYEYQSELARVRPTVDEEGHPRVLAKREDFPPQPDPVGCLGCRFRAICPEGQAVCPLQ